MLEINSKNNQKIKDACSLKIKKYRQEQGLFLMEGIKNLDMALKFGQVKQIFTTIDLPKLPKEIEVFRVNDEVLKKLASSENPEGVVFVSKMQEPKNIDKCAYHKLVYLDQVNDPGNLGTILRTAVAFNYDAVILSKGSVDLYNEKTIAASKGAIFLIDAFYDDLKNYTNNRKVIVTTLDEKSIFLKDSPKFDNFIIVLGNESRGVSKEVMDKADTFVKIDMNDSIDSLNVAVAAGIIMNYFK